MGDAFSCLVRCRQRERNRRRLRTGTVTYHLSTQEISYSNTNETVSPSCVAMPERSGEIRYRPLSSSTSSEGAEQTTSESTTSTSAGSSTACSQGNNGKRSATFEKDDSDSDCHTCWDVLLPCISTPPPRSAKPPISSDAVIDIRPPTRPTPGNSCDWTREDFANYLAKNAHVHFHPPQTVLDRLAPTEQRLKRLGVDMYMHCTATGATPCWMLQVQPAWNYVLNDHGPELIQERPNELTFRTLALHKRILNDAAETLTSLCLVLWLLSQHRCITSMHLNVEVIAPYHIALLYRLMKLHEDYVEVSIEGGGPMLRGLAKHCVFEVFKRMRKLRVIRLSGLLLSAPMGEDMCTLVGNNTDLKTFDLRRVKTDLQSTSSLFKKLAKLSSLEEIHFEVLTEEPVERFAGLIPAILQSAAKKLTLNIACGMSSFFEALAQNNKLQELRVGHPVTTLDSLVALQTSLSQNRTLKYLKVAVVLDKMPGGDIASKAFADLVRKNKGLQVIDLSRSSFKRASPVAVTLLRDALEVTLSLDRVYICDCGLNCADIRRLIEGLKMNSVLRELCVGAVSGSALERALTLQMMVEGQNCDQVTLLWRNDDVPILDRALRGVQQPAFRKLYIRYGGASPPSIASFLGALHKTHAHLHTLFLDFPDAIVQEGALALASLFKESFILRKVAILNGTREETAVTLLDGLAKSRSITVLAIGHWVLDGRVPDAFQTMMEKNTSLLQLDILRDLERSYPIFYEGLAHAIAGSKCLVVLRMFDGPQHVRAFDTRVLVSLRWHEMALRKALSLALSERKYAIASFVLDKIEPFELVGQFFRLDNRWWPGSSRSRLDEAFESVRREMLQLGLIYECLPDLESHPQREFEELLAKCLDNVVEQFKPAISGWK